MKINKEKHAGQLKVQNLYELIMTIKKKYPEQWREIPIYLGDDEELNGIHDGFYLNVIKTKEECNKNDKIFRNIINWDTANPRLEDEEVALIIS